MEEDILEEEDGTMEETGIMAGMEEESGTFAGTMEDLGQDSTLVTTMAGTMAMVVEEDVSETGSVQAL